MPGREIHDLDRLLEILDRDGSLHGRVIQGVDVGPVADRIRSTDVARAVFLGVSMPADLALDVQRRGACLFPPLPGLPYEPYRATLYTPDDLFAGFDPTDPCSYCDTPDATIYRHWVATGREQPVDIMESLARRLHDHAMTDAMVEFLGQDGGRKVVAVMGGHALSRAEAAYRTVARVARSLTRLGYTLTSGGGPGAMEATHLGAWFADKPDDELDAAIEVLAEAPTYRHRDWLCAAYRARRPHAAPGADCASLGIPTWLYGHEPPNLFASHIAKYFANSAREEGLVTIATHGIVFAPGSAGTIQEVFQDATQNHYGSVGVVSPMVFLGRRTWESDTPIAPIIRRMAEGRPYAELVTVLDRAPAIVEFIRDHPPRPVADASWSFCAEFCEE